MPSPKRSAGRTAASDQTRTRILDAARDLAVEEGFSGFTVERVAERAGVSRMTVYYQFGSKADLMEALFDHLAAKGRMDRLAEAFTQRDPLQGLATFIEVFCGFWASDRPGLRRLRGWAAVESDPGNGPQARDAWRREGLDVIVGRIRDAHGVPSAEEHAGVIDLLHTLTSFESYDNLARAGRDREEISDLLSRAARAVMGVRE